MVISFFIVVKKEKEARCIRRQRYNCKYSRIIQHILERIENNSQIQDDYGVENEVKMI